MHKYCPSRPHISDVGLKPSVGVPFSRLEDGVWLAGCIATYYWDAQYCWDSEQPPHISDMSTPKKNPTKYSRRTIDLYWRTKKNQQDSGDALGVCFRISASKTVFVKLVFQDSGTGDGWQITFWWVYLYSDRKTQWLLIYLLVIQIPKLNSWCCWT